VQKRLVSVCEDSLCPRKQPDISGPGLGEAGRYTSSTACVRPSPGSSSTTPRCPAVVSTSASMRTSPREQGAGAAGSGLLEVSSIGGAEEAGS